MDSHQQAQSQLTSVIKIINVNRLDFVNDYFPYQFNIKEFISVALRGSCLSATDQRFNAVNVCDVPFAYPLDGPAISPGDRSGISFADQEDFAGVSLLYSTFRRG